MIEAQDYPRTEFIVTAEGPACGMADDVARLAGSVRFLPFNDPVVNAEAWNRGIRESFAELLILSSRATGFRRARSMRWWMPANGNPEPHGFVAGPGPNPGVLCVER